MCIGETNTLDSLALHLVVDDFVQLQMVIYKGGGEHKQGYMQVKRSR